MALALIFTQSHDLNKLTNHLIFMKTEVGIDNLFILFPSALCLLTSAIS
jgi:hypothetical protein